MSQVIVRRAEAHGLRPLIWSMPAAFAVHIVEEFRGGFPEWVTNVVGGSFNEPAFVANNAVFMSIMLGLAIWADRSASRRSLFFLVLWASANLFWDGLFHIFATAVFDRYSPGLISAALLYIPISLVTAWAVLRARTLQPIAFTAAVVAGLALFTLVVWYGLFHFAT